MDYRGKLFQVIRSFVVSRQQQLRVGSKERATSEVQQGSILSPLLFFIFIDDFPDFCIEVYPLFAVDAEF